MLRPIYLQLCLILLLSSCASPSSWWLNHSDSFHVSAAYQTSELLYDTIRQSDAPRKPLRVPIIIQNDSPAAMRFAKYDSASHAWEGDGVTISIEVARRPKISMIEFDYSLLSNKTVFAGGESSPAWITIEPTRTVVTPGQLVKVDLDIEIKWQWQNRQGEALPLTRVAHLYPELICIGEINPRRVSAQGE